MSELTENVINELIDNSNPEYTAREIELRKLFVKEYLVDYNQVKAAIRCGFAKSYANDYAVKWMEEPFVQKEIKRLESSVDARNCPNDDDARSQIKAALFREANFTGDGSSHGARVSALAKLAAIHGLEAPTKIEQTTTHKGGVMLIPAPVDMRDYERAAIESQAQLIRDASL